MRITFYPRDIGRWRNTFNFRDKLTNPQCVQFRDRAELIEFLKQHGVRLDDPEFPLQFIAGTVCPDDARNLTHTVSQWTCIGWISEIT